MKLELFKDYPAQVINWATHHKAFSLAAGRKLFGDRAVLGGFVNGKKRFCSTKGNEKLLSKKLAAWWLKPEVVVWSLEQTVPYQMISNWNA